MEAGIRSPAEAQRRVHARPIERRQSFPDIERQVEPGARRIV
jgi:hypothetical protein